MHRFFIPAENWNPDPFMLDEAEAHHALDVLRLKTGDRAMVFNGEGVEATVEITGTSKSRVTLRVIGRATTAALPCRLTLAQAIPKGKNMELIIEKATELGAAEIIPLLSERTVIQLDAKDAAKKREKWQAVAVEACKQCGQNRLPAVRRPVSPIDFFNLNSAVEKSGGCATNRCHLPQSGRSTPTAEFGFNANPCFDLMLIASLQPDAKPLKNVLAEFATVHKKRPASALILIGPEGDFTPAEIELAKSAGCVPITLGPIILRTETAAICCLSLLGYELFGV